MSAYSDLIASLAEHPCCFSEADTKKLVDAYAHELAEQIRAEYSNDGPDGDQWRTPLDAADHIDPKVKRP